MIKFVKKGLMSLHHTHSLYVFRDSSKGGHFPTKLAITMQKSLLAWHHIFDLLQNLASKEGLLHVCKLKEL